MNYMVLLLLSWLILPGLGMAGQDQDQGRVSEPALNAMAIPESAGSRQQEIERLRQDIAASKAEKDGINAENELLQRKMLDLKSRIMELKRELLEENGPEDGSALKSVQ